MQGHTFQVHSFGVTTAPTLVEAHTKIAYKILQSERLYTFLVVGDVTTNLGDLQNIEILSPLIICSSCTHVVLSRQPIFSKTQSWTHDST